MTEGFGAFGKIPAVGDFFRLMPPAGFVSVWDEWVQRTILAAQTTLGSGWDDHYMSAPIWRFSLSAGLAGPHRIIGVFMPSVDRVGRRFPLTLMTAVVTSRSTASDHFRAGAIFERLEALALDALEDDMSREKLEQRLTEIPLLASPTAPLLRKSGHSLVMEQDDVLPDLAAEYIGNGWTRPSLWSAMVGDAQRLMVCDGLPEGLEAQGLFHLDAPIWRTGQAA
ncbi:type VI secretion system-associated protein TagF [Sedimentitalea todarodis]|uniref:Type VI secretion system-associated protein TagF n=1 Tax=Sedimentitalea todarodis TaxID=1631240 RepID=A0ABU3VJ71_9RHOB|nr:type VI secretion system-associated protein TagF [Sedimentitalea todarodis]MDU9006180.1 type VI secretion system-associated protein TagF [Sedimentitalea todarodis]